MEETRLIVRSDQEVYIHSGITINNMVNVGDGSEVFKGISVNVAEFRTLKAGLNVSISEVGDEIQIDAGLTGGSLTYIGSGATEVTNPSGNTYVFYSPVVDTSEFVTIPVFSGYTGTTDTRLIIIESDISGNTAQIILNSADIASNITGITANTASIDENVIDITDLYTITSNNYNSITGNTANISANTSGIVSNYNSITGNTANISANTSGIVSNYHLITGNTADIHTHTGDTSIHFTMDSITGFTSTSDFETYTGTTQTELDGKASNVLIEKNVTGTTYTVLSGDSNMMLLCTNTGDTVITLPASVALGFNCSIMNAAATGVVSFSATGGVFGKGDKELVDQYDTTLVYKYNKTSNRWKVVGGIT